MFFVIIYVEFMLNRMFVVVCDRRNKLRFLEDECVLFVGCLFFISFLG